MIPRLLWSRTHNLLKNALKPLRAFIDLRRLGCFNEALRLRRIVVLRLA
jgi:hypothetical protein